MLRTIEAQRNDKANETTNGHAPFACAHSKKPRNIAVFLRVTFLLDSIVNQFFTLYIRSTMVEY